ncbi:hypothetical protein MMC28_003252 [Mycoblastus sanguinarius]|nr:hypothetical protein [Mycoblastus sanguinarius]
MPPNLPYDVDIGQSTMRITAYRSPHVPSHGLLPCLVSMLTTSFDATWEQNDKTTNLEDGLFLCQNGALELKVGADQAQPPDRDMQYSDLVILANLMMSFQQRFIMPGLVFKYLIGGQVIGNGLLWLIPGSSTQ